MQPVNPRILCVLDPSGTGNSSSNKQEYQLLKDNLVRSYNKALKKNAPYSIFAIKNGPKSHIGRHLMTSFLSMKGLTE
ncbi:hypothetical protein, partial [Bacillus cereus]